MGLRQCAVCKKMVHQGDEIEHLRTNHLGPHYFMMNACEYKTDEPSMTGAEVRHFTDSGSHGYLVEDRGNHDLVYYSDSEAIDLTHHPNLFVLLPATMYG